MQLQLRGITKHFGSLAANQGVDLSVGPGEIHALLGENGAGKTTLMNVLFGLYDPDDGEILLDGKPVAFSSPKGAIAAGIGMVHQHFALVPVFSVAENVILGDEPVGLAGWLKRNKARQEIRELSRSYGFEVDPDATVRDLPVGLQQRTEILKALLREAQVLILDEPTAVLTPQEIRDLFLIMRRLSEAGRSMLFITHKLKEVMEIADRITIMRAGRERYPTGDCYCAGSSLRRSSHEKTHIERYHCSELWSPDVSGSCMTTLPDIAHQTDARAQTGQPCKTLRIGHAHNEHSL